MNLLIIGAGAIGTLVGSKLAQAEHDVTLVGRRTFAEVVRERGITLIEPSGTQCVRNLRAASNMADAIAQSPVPYDLAILTVKGYDTVSTLAEMSEAAAQHDLPLPPILSLQNGVGNEEAIASVIGAERVLAGNITTPVTTPEIGVVRVEKPRYGIGLALWIAGIEKSEETLIKVKIPLAVTQSALTEAGFNLHLYPHAQSMKWTKLLLNLPGNASSAILDEPPAQVFADARLADLEIEAWRETLNVMRGAGIPVMNMDGYPLRNLAWLIRLAPNAWLRPFVRKMVAGGRGKKMPSLHIDLAQGKGKSEVGWLNGAVMSGGKRAAVATPVNTVLTQTLTELVQKGEGDWSGWRGNHQRLLDAVEEQRGKG